MPKERIIDFVSGKPVEAKPEEMEAVQPFCRMLVEDYHYPKKEIIAHPQLRVRANPSDSQGYPVDIAVFEGKGTGNEKLKMIVECKRKTRKEGREQLELYLKFCEAEIGVWYNGNESLYLKKVEEPGKISFSEIPAIPAYKEKISEIGCYRRKQLVKTHNLKDIFLDIRGYLVGNATGTTRDEFIAKQMINLILCKIYDERFTAPEDLVSFRTSVDDTDKDVQDRIKERFKSVKGKYSDVLDDTDTIELDAHSLRHVVGKLQKFCVIECERDVVSDAFEVFIGYSLKGEKGQFFTPANVIRLMVQIVNPLKGETVIDPACGSGGFLVESLRHIWKQIDEQGKRLNWNEEAKAEEKKDAGINYIRGIDKDSFLTKVAKSYMAILGDGKGGIFCEDSLENPKDWKDNTKAKIRLESFDAVLTNPPFGKDIKVVGKDKLGQFSLSKKITNGSEHMVDEGNVSTLFLERSLQLLKDGGRIGIILPETYFHAPSQRHVLDFIFRHNVFCVIDLPHNTFRPYNNAKCCAVFLEKNKPQQEKILMGVAEQMGHNHQGKPIFRLDEKGRQTKEIWDDICEIQKELKGRKGKFTFEVEASLVKIKNILIPRYYWKHKQEDLDGYAKEKNLRLVSLQELLDKGVIECFDGNGSPKAQFKGLGEIPYVRVKDIVNWQVYTDVTALIPNEEYERLHKKEKELKPKDILYVRRGSYRIGSVAMVSPYNLKCILTREILVIRMIKEDNEFGISPEFLMYALSHAIVADESRNKVFIDTTLPNIADRWKEIRIPIPTDGKRKKDIEDKMKRIVANHWNAQKEIEECKADYDVYSV